MNRKIFLVSRCAWTLYNFRAGLMSALMKRGYIVEGGGSGGDGFEPKIEALGVPFCPLPVDKKGINPVADLKLFLALYHWYRRERPGIVHHFTIKPVIYGSIAAKLAGVPRIVNTITGLGYVFIEDDIRWLQVVVQSLYRVALACADLTFFQNNDDYEVFLSRHLVSFRKTALLPGSGVDCDHFSPQYCLNDQDRSHRALFLMVGRLLREKGVYEFVEAARRVRQLHPEAMFWLVGDRDERNPTVVPLDELKKWEKDKVIIWKGSVPDVRPVVAEADVIVLPSYREGTPRALLEAAAMGKPIITTDAVGCREVVDDGVNGLCVPVKNVEALVTAMVRMIQSPDIRFVMGKAGIEKVKREFEEKIVIEKILKAYEGEKV